MIATADTGVQAYNGALSAYWTRTLGLFAGLRISICLTDGRTRTGVLVGSTHLDVGDGCPVSIPLDQISSIEVA